MQVKHLSLLFSYILLPKQERENLAHASYPSKQPCSGGGHYLMKPTAELPPLHTPAALPGCRLARDIPWNAPSPAGSCVMHEQPGLLPGHRAGISRGYNLCHGLAACASHYRKAPSFPISVKTKGFCGAPHPLVEVGAWHTEMLPNPTALLSEFNSASDCPTAPQAGRGVTSAGCDSPGVSAGVSSLPACTATCSS